MLLGNKQTLFNLTFAALVTAISAGTDTDNRPLLRGRIVEEVQSNQNQRLLHLPPHHSKGGGGGGSGSGEYYGCLEMDSSQQDQEWHNGPDCDYGSNSGGGDDDNAVNTNYEVTDDDGTTSSNPYDDFAISKCETYESLWRWDLHMSCGSDNSNLDSCDCTFAQELFDKGLLVCEDRERCPRSCPVCSTCLTILGCPDSAGLSSSLDTATIIYIVVGAVILLVIALALFHARRRSQHQNDLNQHLMEDADEKGMPDSSRDRELGWEPPALTGSGAMVGAAVLKSSKDDNSQADTDDCGDSLDATVPTVDETMANTAETGTVAAAIAKFEASAPEDETESDVTESKNVDSLRKMFEGEEKTSDVTLGNSDGATTPNESVDVGAVREAFRLSMEQYGTPEQNESSPDDELADAVVAADAIDAQQECTSEAGSPESEDTSAFESARATQEDMLQEEEGDATDDPAQATQEDLLQEEAGTGQEEQEESAESEVEQPEVTSEKALDCDEPEAIESKNPSRDAEENQDLNDEMPDESVDAETSPEEEVSVTEQDHDTLESEAPESDKVSGAEEIQEAPKDDQMPDNEIPDHNEATEPEKEDNVSLKPFDEMSAR